MISALLHAGKCSLDFVISFREKANIDHIYAFEPDIKFGGYISFIIQYFFHRSSRRFRAYAGSYGFVLYTDVRWSAKMLPPGRLFS